MKIMPEQPIHRRLKSGFAPHWRNGAHRALLLAFAMMGLCAVAPRTHAAGSLQVWGTDDYGVVTNKPTGNNFVAVSGGHEAHMVALRSDGSIASWGYDALGEVSGTPAGNDFVSVSAGGAHSIALRSDGSIVAWGHDCCGQVSLTPTGTGFVAVSGGGNFNLALRTDGSLATWGANYYGETSGLPAGNDFVAIAAGELASVALRSDGSLAAWGYNLGTGQVSGVPAGNDFVAISAGYGHSVALRSDGSLISWGYDYYGQVSGTPAGNDFVAVSAGQLHSIALRSDGTLVSWGSDILGEVSGTPTGGGFTAVSGGGFASVAIAPVVTPEAQIAVLGDGVQALVTGGALLPAQGNSLLTKLDAALSLMTSGNTHGATAKLTDFIKQVANFVKTGKLTSAQGQPLIDAAQALIDELQAAAAATSSASTARTEAIGRPSATPHATLAVPASFRLYPAMSDAARGVLTLHFDLPRSSEVTVEFYDLGGRRLDEVRLGSLGPGRQEWSWTARNHASALVFYRLKAGDFMATGKAALVR